MTTDGAVRPHGRALVRGVELAYQRAGDGPDLVWGHGLSTTRASEDRLPLLDWARIPASVVRYDARGHGESGSTPDLDAYTWAELAQDQLTLADALGIGPYIVAGASMGAGTALHVAVLAPERVRAVVLVIPPTSWETRAAQAERWGESADLVERAGVEAYITARALMPPPDPFVGDEERKQISAEMTRTWDPARLARVLRGSTRANAPDREAVRAIAVPTLVLAWSGDPVHPVEVSEELQALLPDARLHVANTREQVATWTDLVADFVREVG